MWQQERNVLQCFNLLFVSFLISHILVPHKIYTLLVWGRRANYNSSLKNTSTCFEGAQRKPKQLKQESDTIEDFSRNKTDKTFSWRKKNNIFQNTVLFFPQFISYKMDHWLLWSKGCLPSFLQKLTCFKINRFIPFT